MQRVKIAYILSVGHSGSSILDVLLGSSENAVSIGEVKLNDKGHISNLLCTCGLRPKMCGFWAKVDERSKSQGKSIFDIDFSSEKSETELNEIVDFYRNIASVAGANLVVDSSKSISRLRVLLSIKDRLDLRLIFLERSPFGVVASNKRKGRSWIRHTFFYLLNNSSKRQLASRYDHLRISYEEIASNPEQAVAKIYKYLGLDTPKSSLFCPDLATEKHMLGGNSMLYKPISEIKEDTRWKSELTLVQKLFIGAICHPAAQYITCCSVALIRKLKHYGHTPKMLD